MKALVWKDFRNNQSLTLIGIALFLLPMVLVVSMILTSDTESGSHTLTQLLAGGVWYGAGISLAFSQLTLLFLGGQIIAGERASLTSHFLFYQPASRARIAASKLVYCLLNVVAIWLAYTIIKWISFSMMPVANEVEQAVKTKFASDFPAEVAAAGALLFGIAWLASSLMESTTLPMGISALVLGVLLVAIQIIRSRMGFEGTAGSFDPWRVSLFWTLGAAGIIGGFIIFTRRIEP